MRTSGRAEWNRARRLALAIWVVSLVAASAPADAFIPVDSFRDPLTLLLPSGTDQVLEEVIEAGPGGVIAGVRDIVLRRMETGALGDAALEVSPSGIERLLLDDEGVALELTLVYDGPVGDAEAIDPSGLGAIDLNEAGTDERFSIRLRSKTASTVVFQVFESGHASGDRWSRGSWFVPATPSLTWIEFPFEDLLEPGPAGDADLGRIGAILVSISGEASSALEVDEIRVPEPGASGGGLAALAALQLLARLRAAGCRAAGA